jgi:hypothetical protein
VISALKESFNIWLKKCGYNSQVATKAKNTSDWIKGIDDYYDDDKRDDASPKYSKWIYSKKSI